MQCTSYFDLGIYSEALRYLSWGDLNPFIPGRNIRIFNDHFDPILIPFSLFSSWIPAPVLGILIEAAALLLCWLPLRQLRDHGKISENAAFFAYAFFLLNAATIDAVYTPFHPTTWACLPLMFVFSNFWIRNFKGMTIALFFLFCCREEFPLIGLPLGLILIYEKEHKWGHPIFIGSALWCLFVFKLRPLWFEGEFMTYGGDLMKNAASTPLQIVASQLNFGKFRMFLERTLSLLALLQLTNIRKNLGHSIKILFIASPLLLIRLASDHWAFHYGTAAVISFLFIFFPAFNDSRPSEARQRFAWAFLLVIFFSPAVKTLFSHGGNRCPATGSRIEELRKAQNWVKESGKNKILTENNLAGMQLMRLQKDQKIYTFGGMHPQSIAPFDVVLLEQPPYGDPWPSDHSKVMQLIEQWRRNPEVRVITDNEHIFLAEGKIAPDRL